MLAVLPNYVRGQPADIISALPLPAHPITSDSFCVAEPARPRESPESRSIVQTDM